jgi:hypothetical protein
MLKFGLGSLKVIESLIEVKRLELLDPVARLLEQPANNVHGI